MVSYGNLLDTSGAIEDDEDYLDQIIERINERYQGDFGDKDFYEAAQSAVREMVYSELRR